MRIRRTRSVVASTLLVGAVFVAPAGASAARVEFARGTIDQALTSDRPGTPTGTRFSARYHAAGDRDAPPPYMRKMTFYPSAGWRWDTSVPGAPSSSVYPSGGDLATSVVPIRPPAPGRFSTITGCPRTCVSPGAMARAVMSMFPPGANGTTMRIGLDG